MSLESSLAPHACPGRQNVMPAVFLLLIVTADACRSSWTKRGAECLLLHCVSCTHSIMLTTCRFSLTLYLLLHGRARTHRRIDILAPSTRDTDHKNASDADDGRAARVPSLPTVSASRLNRPAACPDAAGRDAHSHARCPPRPRPRGRFRERELEEELLLLLEELLLEEEP